VTHEEAQELLGAYALDAVGADEAALVAAHVQGCPRCTAELAELREVAAMLASTGSDAPGELWERISSQATRPEGAVPRTPVLVGPSARRHRARRRGAVLVGAAAAVAAIVTIALLASQVSTLDRRVDALAGTAQRQGIALAAQAAMQAPGTTTLPVNAASGAGQVATVVLVRGAAPSFFVNHGLAALPPTRTYQLWGVADGTAVSLGLLGARPGIVAFVASARRGATTFAVTVERAAGAAQPTSAPIASSPTTA
jgi:hypothetical protein